MYTQGAILQCIFGHNLQYDNITFVKSAKVLTDLNLAQEKVNFS